MDNTTYINKIHLLFPKLGFTNLLMKRAWLQVSAALSGNNAFLISNMAR
jgi:hypothetical protein